MKSNSISIFALAVAASLAAPTSAQESTQENETASDDTRRLETVEVNATRRDTNLQDTALSVSAVSGDQLSDLGFDSIAEAIFLVPGVSTLSDQPGGNDITIRGVNTNSTTFSQTDVLVNSTTAVYLDQVPVTSTIAKTPDFRFVDMSRVEVLRGPQDTLYGQSAMGGVVRYITNRPDTDGVTGSIGGYVSSTEDGGTNTGAEGFVNLPISDTFAVRFAGYSYENTGFIDVIGTAMVEDANDENTIGGRAALRWTPTDRITLDVGYLYHEVELESLPLISSTYTPTGDPALNGFPQDLVPVSEDRLVSQHLQPTYDEYNIFTGELLVEFDAFDLNVIAARKETETENQFEAAELVGNSETFAGNSNFGETESDTLEIRIVSNQEGRFDWLAGLWYEDADGQLAAFAQVFGTPLDFGFLAVPVGGIAIDSGRQLTYEELAFYGEFGINFTDELRLTLGYRRSNIENNYEWTFADGALDPLLGRTGIIGLDQTTEEDVDTYRINLEYAPSDNLLFYGQASSGYRPGGFNPGSAFAVPPIPDSEYQSDTLWNYEVGMRSTWLENRLLFNAVGYFIDWSDLQLATTQLSFPFFSSTINAGEAEVFGIELEAAYQVTDELTLSGSYAYTEAELAEAGETPPGFGSPPGQEGDALPGTPENAFAAVASWNRTLENGNALFANATYRFVDDRQAALGGTIILPSYSLANASAGISLENGVTATLFVDNLTNEIVNNTTTPGGFLSGESFRYISISRPRTIGIRARYEF